MIIGIGTDIVEIVRIKKAIQRWGRRFLDRIYTEDEISYCYLKKNPFPRLAGRFAAKEAALKAFSWVFESQRISFDCESKIKNLRMRDIEIINNKNGMPYIIIKNSGFNVQKMNFSIHLTISHERVYAVANVVIETVNG